MRVIDSYDAALFDLDGVVYLGAKAVDGAVAGLAKLRAAGKAVAFVTNNAARPPQTVVDQLVGLGIPSDLSDVVTSAQVTATMVARQLPVGSRVLIAGTQALADEIRGVGMVIVESADDQPDAVVQGYDPHMTQPRLDEAAIAIQQGARWFATNTDSTRPVERGLVPGCGTQINAVKATVSVTPEVAGKPYPPLLNATVDRLGAASPIFVGDRLDTDIMGAVAVGMDSLFVFTGAHGVRDLAEVGPEGRPTHIGWGLGALLDAPRQVSVAGGVATCRGQQARLDAGRLELGQVPQEREAQLDLLWAGLQLVWSSDEIDSSELDRLTLLH